MNARMSATLCLFFLVRAASAPAQKAAATGPVGKGPTGRTVDPVPQLRLRPTPLTAAPRYGLSSVALLAPETAPAGMAMAGQRRRLGTGEPRFGREADSGYPREAWVLGRAPGSGCEILAWSTGIGAAVGLADGLINGHDEVEATLLGAAYGFALPILVAILVSASMPAVPARPRQPARGLSDPVPPSTLRARAAPWINLRISGRRARGGPDRYLLLGVGADFRLSYVTGW